MKTINTLKFSMTKAKGYWMAAIMGIISCGFACEEDLPDVGELEDTTPPVAEFQYEVDGDNYLNVDFVNLSESASHYAWDFGDGFVSDEEHTEHTYSEIGSYIVKLVSYDNNAALSDMVDTVIIAIPPVAAFTYEKDLTAEEDNTFVFTNTSEDAVSYEWNFGNGVKSTEVNPQITYSSDGIYTVTLTVVNAAGIEDDMVIEIPIGAERPVLLNPGFETLESTGTGSACYCYGWFVSDIGKQPQTTSDTYEGSGAIKIPSDGTRVGYQEVAVTPNYTFNLRFYYSGNTDGAGLKVQILSEPISSFPEAEALVIAEILLEGTGGTKTWEAADFDFYTGSSSTVAILITGSGTDYRLDNMDVSVVYE